MEHRTRIVTDQDVPTRFQSRRASIERDYESEMDDAIQAALKGDYELPPATELAGAPRVLKVVSNSTDSGSAMEKAAEFAPRPGRPRPPAPAPKKKLHRAA